MTENGKQIQDSTLNDVLRSGKWRIKGQDGKTVMFRAVSPFIDAQT